MTTPKTPKCKHTKSPDGYLQHAQWAEDMLKTHKQIKCPNCGLWAVWIKKIKK
jgi:hypothetical protein